MISFASERGLGQDLATHLLNAEQNELVELAYVRGAVADDLHGAFAEWEVQAKALTKCKNYLYSMSINPDPAQDRLSRDQYMDYIKRVEVKLGLENQPCAAVFHIKNGREHCHVVWSKIDVEKEKAVHLAFDHDKLMAVTRQFAKDHSLNLPQGYYKKGGNSKEQMTLYQKEQERITGIPHDELVRQITDAWRGSDNAKAFVQALADKGFILAQGKRPYVVVDFYGNVNALPRLIDDKRVRTKDIRAFLEKSYPSESLPTVLEARKLIGDHRKSIEADFRKEQRDEQMSLLKRSQALRRKDVEKDAGRLKVKHDLEQTMLLQRQKEARIDLRWQCFRILKERKCQRQKADQPSLTRFLGQLTGVKFIRDKLQERQDRKLLTAYREERKQLLKTQKLERGDLNQKHSNAMFDTRRKLKTLDQIEKREIKTLEQGITREARVAQRGGKPHMPKLKLDMAPRGMPFPASPRANNNKAKTLENEFIQARDHKTRDIDLAEEFGRAASGGDDSARGSTDSGQIKPKRNPDIVRHRLTRSRDNEAEHER
ncbi:MAG: relaxase/mobilization nuclease domain-containing protein [Anaerolineaceae bacterium]|nr:relaxase/mobilization nuclease domain-containing protein [Anaerolineaceae bacterium]